MIKKLNIVLLVCVLALIGVKYAKDLKSVRKAARNDAAVAAMSRTVRNGEIAPRIYCSQWHPFVNLDKLSNRNGYIVDVLRSIFPRLEVKITRGGVTNAVQSLRSDPDALVVYFGDHPALADFPKAPTPISWKCYGLFFSRDMKWKYTGPASLDDLKIACTECELDSPVIRAFRDKWKDTPGKFTIVPGDTFESTDFTVGEKIEYNAVAGMLKGSAAEQARSDADLYTHFSRSSPIDTVKIYLRCSKLDPERTRRFIDAYEKGIKEIEKSGELRRIREYYGFMEKPEDIRW